MALAFNSAGVASWLRLDDPSVEDLAVLSLVVTAVTGQVDRFPDTPRAEAIPPAVGQWTDEAVLGALMLAARLYRRRNSPNGVEAFLDSGAAYVSRYDPDVARIFGLDAFTRPRVG